MILVGFQSSRVTEAHLMRELMVMGQKEVPGAVPYWFRKSHQINGSTKRASPPRNFVSGAILWSEEVWIQWVDEAFNVK
jgi:hypothetical protein